MRNYYQGKKEWLANLTKKKSEALINDPLQSHAWFQMEWAKAGMGLHPKVADRFNTPFLGKFGRGNTYIPFLANYSFKYIVEMMDKFHLMKTHVKEKLKRYENNGFTVFTIAPFDSNYLISLIKQVEQFRIEKLISQHKLSRSQALIVLQKMRNYK